MPALYTVLSVTMTQIVSTLASLLQGAWHPGHTQSALLCAVTTPHKRHVPAGPVARAPLPSPRVPGTAVFSIVFGPLVQQCQQEAASPKLVSPAQPQDLLFDAVSVLYKLMDMKTSLGLAQCQISWFHPTSGTVYLVSDPGW